MNDSKKEFKVIEEKPLISSPVGIVIAVGAILAVIFWGSQAETFFRDQWEFFWTAFFRLLKFSIPLLILFNFLFKSAFGKVDEKECDKSIDNLPIDKIYEGMSNLIKENKKNNDIPKPNEILLENEKQNEFLENEFLEITTYIKNRIINSSILPIDHELRKLVKDKNSKDDILKVVIPKLIELINPCKNKYDLSILHRAYNRDKFFSILGDYCKKNSIELDIYLVRKYYNNRFKEVVKNIMTQLVGSRRGLVGERRVSEHLDLYRDILIDIPNVRFEVENTSVEADNVVICDKGVFCIETKNYGSANERLVITRDGQWKRYKGNKEIPIKNITEQHNRHIGIMQRFINNELKAKGFNVPYIKFEDIYVIGNNDISIDNSSNLRIVRPSNVYNQIQIFNSSIKLSTEVQNAIVEIINTNKKGSKKYAITSYKSQFEAMFDELVRIVEEQYYGYSYEDMYIDCLEQLGKEVVIREGSGRYIWIKNT